MKLAITNTLAQFLLLQIQLHLYKQL